MSRLRTALLPLLGVLLLAGCTTAADPGPAAGPTTDPALAGQVAAAFATYRTAVQQGDGDAAAGAVTEASRQQVADIAALARTADEEAVRALPATQQLLVLTMRLRPELLDADDPYRALVDAGLAGQDRSLGELGDISSGGTDLALGVVVDAASGTPTPLRWRFLREDGTWRLDLVDAHRLLSQAIASSGARSGVTVDQLVTDTVVDLSGASPAEVQALYAGPPAA